MQSNDKNVVRIIEEWKNQLAANDVAIPEGFEPEILVGEKFGQEYTEVSGLGTNVRVFKRNRYSIGSV